MSETASWQPSASIPNLLKRAAIMAEIRRFFADRGVLEVETPCMSQATVTDIHLVPFETRFVGRYSSCAAASVMKRWGVITTLSSLCWSGIDRTMICTG